jgi:hypothetical protein
MKQNPDLGGNAKTVVNGSTGKNTVAEYQSTVSATAYRISGDANSPKYIIPSSIDNLFVLQAKTRP